MFFIPVTLGPRPRPLFPSILPSSNNSQHYNREAMDTYDIVVHVLTTLFSLPNLHATTINHDRQVHEPD